MNYLSKPLIGPAITIIVALATFTSTLGGSIKSRDVVGTWSNKEESFAVLQVLLRDDGQGILLAGGIQSIPLRWTLARGSVAIELPDEGKTRSMTMTTVGSADAAQVVLYDGTTQRFHRVSTKNPPDFLAEMRAARKAQIENTRRDQTMTVVRRSEDLVDALAPVLAVSTTLFQRARVTSGSDWDIMDVSQMKGHATVGFIDSWAGKAPDPYTTERKRSESPPTESWPVSQLIDDQRLEQLKAWCTDRNITFQRWYSVHSSAWGPQRYEGWCIVETSSAATDLADIVAFLATNTATQASFFPANVWIVAPKQPRP